MEGIRPPVILLEKSASSAPLDYEKGGSQPLDSKKTTTPWELSPQHPRNWPYVLSFWGTSSLGVQSEIITSNSLSKRWKNALIISITGFLSTTGSSIFVPAAAIIAVEFQQPNREIVVLTTALYVLGLGWVAIVFVECCCWADKTAFSRCGPFLFAPISELYGRQVSYSTSMIGKRVEEDIWSIREFR